MSLDGRDPAPLLLGNLLNDLPVLASLLAREVERGAWLDAYLLAAGMSQIVDDHVSPVLQPLDAIVRQVAARPTAGADLGARAAAAVVRAMDACATSQADRTTVLRWRVQLHGLVDALADRVVGVPATCALSADPVGAANALARAVDALPTALLRTPLRLPACFHSFDQHPRDLGRLVDAFHQRWRSRGRPVLVVGVRTSGSYLAPLIAAELRARGYGAVRVLTVRPGRALPRSERTLVRQAARRGGLALLTDDPPVTGTSLARVARTLCTFGLGARDVVLLLQLFGSEDDLPVALRPYPAVVLPWEQWTVQDRLDSEHVRATLGTLLGADHSVLAAERLPLACGRRGHCRARFRVELSGEDVDDGPYERLVLVEGVGQGYLGAHSLAVTRRLATFSPHVFGLRDGLLYREWLPEERRAGSPPGERELAIADSIAAYVAKRRRALAVEEDISLHLAGDQPAWEVASTILSRVYGRARLAARPLLTDRVAKRLLRVERPSVVDGNTDLDRWFIDEHDDARVTKLGPAERSFWHLGLACFDAAFDLAGATARASDARFARRLRQAYVAETGERVDEERWLLYELAHLWGRGRTDPHEAAALRRAAARALQRYFGEVYLDGVAPPRASGPLCALDLDGVLETEHLGFPSLAPAAARSLRALLSHGYRPVVASGRSAGEIVERCRAYGLAGGVAEYGAAIYETAGDRLRVLLPAEGARTLDRVRAVLRTLEGVHVDPDYRYTVRAFRLGGGRPRGLDAATTARALSAVRSGAIAAIEGDCQTDFTIAAVDKGVGVRALAEGLGAGARRSNGRPLAFAVGDAATDLSAFDLAAIAFAPAHAKAVMRGAAVTITRRPYQSGLEEAVGKILGHRPGGCARCAPPRLTLERELLMRVLGAQERGRIGMGVQAVGLAAARW